MSTRLIKELSQKYGRELEARCTSQNDVCWQKLKRDEVDIYDDFADRNGLRNLNAKDGSVELTTRHIAKQIILRYEWLGTMTGATQYYGIFWDSFCGGVCCYTIGAAGLGGWGIYNQFGIEQKNMAYLSRGACANWAPHNANSRLVGQSLKMLPEHVEIVIAYSDTDAGEIGTIYQATNWLCLGRTQSNHLEAVSPEGRVISEFPYRNKAKKAGLSYPEFWEGLLQRGWTFRYNNPKIRWMYLRGPRKDKLRAKIEHQIQPYPKRHENRTDAIAP